MLPTVEELQAMREMDIRQADRDKLADIGAVSVDRTQSRSGRIRSYLEQVHNPYLVRSGEYVVKFKYADGEREIDDCMAEYVTRLAQLS